VLPALRYPPPPPPATLTFHQLPFRRCVQLYEYETQYLQADYTNCGSVLRVRRVASGPASSALLTCAAVLLGHPA